MSRRDPITILGGGMAGLAAGYYARKSGLPFQIFEAGDRVGGNCITIKHGDFLFDSGAHRFHDRDPEVTEVLKKLLGEDLRKINVPSYIYRNGKLIDFPLRPLNLLKKLGLIISLKAVAEIMGSRWLVGGENENFKNYVIKKYGKTISDLFLLNYSQKLWGLPGERLSPKIAEHRMKGLDLGSFLKEAFLGSRAKTEHFDGSFYYPENGIGAIMEKLGEICRGNINRNARITRILHDNEKIKALEVNGKELIDTDLVISTIPLNHFVKMLEPAAPEEVVFQSEALKYRNIILVALFLNRKSVSDAATVYFPEEAAPFTRIFEPKNRSSSMSPPGKTSLVAEIPCKSGDNIWGEDREYLVGTVRSYLVRTSWIKEEEVMDSVVIRLENAYPVLEAGFEERVRRINEYLGGLTNLKLAGRSGTFSYSWIHDMMRSGREIIEEYVDEPDDRDLYH